MMQPRQPPWTLAQVASEVMQEVVASSPAATEALRRRPDAVAAFQQACRPSSRLLPNVQHISLATLASFRVVVCGCNPAPRTSSVALILFAGWNAVASY